MGYFDYIKKEISEGFGYGLDKAQKAFTKTQFAENMKSYVTKEQRQLAMHSLEGMLKSSTKANRERAQICIDILKTIMD